MEAGTETFIGGMLDILGDIGKGAGPLSAGAQVCSRGRLAQAEGSALSNIGKIHNDVAEWQKALEFYGQALRVFQSDW